MDLKTTVKKCTILFKLYKHQLVPLVERAETECTILFKLYKLQLYHARSRCGEKCTILFKLYKLQLKPTAYIICQ